MTVSPPQSSASRPRSASCCLMRSGWASGLSILLMATMIGTLAALAWSMASSVCGITPSSAATTSTTMSVTLAPRARMRVKASWPGVSMKTILRPFSSTLVGADVLGDAAGLAPGHVGFADGVEQRGLAVVDVAHDGDHGRALHEILLRLRPASTSCMASSSKLTVSVEAPKLAGDIVASFDVERLVDGGENALVEQLLDHQVGLHVRAFRRAP